jgi:glucose-1-phosphate thymidylyltransferase
MKIVIPTAGFGTRLRPHTWSKPKPLIPVAGKPVLAHVLDTCMDIQGLEQVIFIVGYLGEQIESYVSETYPDLETRFVVQEEMLGQSHAISLAKDFLSGPMLMVFVDTLIFTDLSHLGDEKVDGLIWVKEVEDPRRFGVAEVDEEDKVLRLIEKPQEMDNNLAVVGFYYFKRAEQLIQAIDQQLERQVQLKGEFFLADAVNIMLESGLDMRVERIDIWLDAGKPETVLSTNRFLLENGHDNSIRAAQRERAEIIPPVNIHETAEVIDSVIGPNVSVGPHCAITRSVVSDSILDAEARVLNSVLTDSIIGRAARVDGSARRLNIGDTSELDFT